MNLLIPFDKSLITIKKILSYRGYDVDAEEEIDGIYQLTAFKDGDSSECLTVFWHPNPKFGTNDAQFYEKQISPSKNCIVVLKKDQPSPAAKEYINNLYIQGVFMEYFFLDELQYDIMQNRFVPKHEIMSESEKREVMLHFSVTENQLPKILMKDAVARYIGAKKGHLIRITRKSEVLGENVLNYRIVV